MTEEIWLGPAMPTILLGFVSDKTTGRKLRLFAVAVCRVLERAVSEDCLIDAVQDCEQFADGFLQKEDLAHTREMLRRSKRDYLALKFGIVDQGFENPHSRGRLPKAANDWISIWNIHESCIAPEPRNAARDVLWRSISTIRTMPIRDVSTSVTGTILRDIFGNPFRPIAIDPRWLTSTVVDLASAIYQEKAFDRMPILADALMDAGCDNEEIIAHCRGEGPHVRGCWAVDLLLGKS